jgi:hypothetical protein
LEEIITSEEVLVGECIDVVVRDFCWEEEDTEELFCRDEGLDGDKPADA